MTIDRKTVLTLVAGLALGYWFAGSGAPPKPDRPLVRWVVRAAKSFLWFATFAERPPEPEKQDQRFVQAPGIGEDGYPIIDHGRGL